MQRVALCRLRGAHCDPCGAAGTRASTSGGPLHPLIKQRLGKLVDESIDWGCGWGFAFYVWVVAPVSGQWLRGAVRPMVYSIF